jgi:L-ascorbate metabolism protein UlaG (beta-lactamase superfamily)
MVPDRLRARSEPARAPPHLSGSMIRWDAFGASPSGKRLARIARSRQYADGAFRNPWPQQMRMGRALAKWVRGAPNREPTAAVPVLRRAADEFRDPPKSGLRVSWLGHSSTLIEIGGLRLLTDPVFSHRISPVSFAGPKRFWEAPIAAEALPPIDAVLLSHDHYDHLDLPTVRALGPTTFVTPLGVGAHLESWGVDPARIVELDWWEATSIGAHREVEIVCTPARHFSGRAPGDRDRTLWGGFAIRARGPAGPRSVFFSGDTAMFPGFADVGRDLGPFDLTMIEAGAYDQAWADVHIGPEQAVRAHQMLRGEVMLPLHWGTFNLALHAWTEPAERAIEAARAANVALAIPRPGGWFEPKPLAGERGYAIERWWPEIAWQRADEAPVISSGLDFAHAG